jgi:hypothetical protein
MKYFYIRYINIKTLTNNQIDNDKINLNILKYFKGNYIRLPQNFLESQEIISKSQFESILTAIEQGTHRLIIDIIINLNPIIDFGIEDHWMSTRPPVTPIRVC